jgi:hypothetical protein
MPRAQRTKSAVDEALQRRAGERPGASFSVKLGGRLSFLLPSRCEGLVDRGKRFVREGSVTDELERSLVVSFHQERSPWFSGRLSRRKRSPACWRKQVTAPFSRNYSKLIIQKARGFVLNRGDCHRKTVAKINRFS